MIRSTSFVHLPDGASAAAVDEVVALYGRSADEIDALSVQAAPTLPPAHRAGNVMVLAAYRDIEQYEAAQHHPYFASVVAPALAALGAEVESVRYEQGAVRLQAPDLAGGVQRTLLVSVLPGADPGVVREWAAATAAMTDYISTIRNSSVSRVDAVDGARGPVWTHVWEQEYEDLAGLTGPYMLHAHHWAWVDRWFDPQQPLHIIDTTLVHSMCDIERSVLALA